MNNPARDHSLTYAPPKADVFPKNLPQKPTAYAASGVDIKAGADLIQAITPHAKATACAGTNGTLGGFGGVFDIAQCGIEDPLLVAANDGVGTKLKIAIELNEHQTIGIDLVAMCVNDLLVQGAKPLFFLDYFATNKLDVEQARAVIAGIADGCKQAGCALIGGETAEMPGFYKNGDYDLAGFSVGAVSRSKLLPRVQNIAAGDIVLGLRSDGIHSNGFSLVRHLLAEAKHPLDAPPPFSSQSKTLGEALLTPTRIYTDILPLLDNDALRGLAHITGGGLSENIPRILPDTLAAEIDLANWELPSVFAWLAELGDITRDEMLSTFNCGIGMVMIIAPEAAAKMRTDLKKLGFDALEIGKIILRASGDNADGVVYRSVWTS